jgi:serine/threonine-protein kinase
MGSSTRGAEDAVVRVTRRVGWALASTLALASAPGEARAAGESDAVSAEILFRTGRALMAEHKFAEACPKLAESERLDPASGTLVALALCHEGEEKNASAWVEFTEAVDLARRDGRNDRADFARAHAAALEPKLARLTITVAASGADIVVTRDGTRVAPAVFGVAVPVDPGEHHVTAEAPGRAPWTSVIVVGRGAEAKTVAIPELSPAAASATPAPAHAPSGAAAQGVSGRMIATIATASAGLVALGVGTYFGVATLSKMHDVDAACPAGAPCLDAKAVATSHDAHTTAAVTDVALGVGAIAIAGAATLFFTSRPQPPKSAAGDPRGQALRIGGAVTANGGAVRIEAVF